MTTCNFDALFEPTSVALIEASSKERSLGNVIRHNLVRGGFDGTLYFVNPRYDTIDGQPCVPNVSALPDRLRAEHWSIAGADALVGCTS